MRHEEYSMLQIMLQGKTEGKRNIGRKRKWMLQNTKEWTWQNTSTLFHMAEDRQEFALMTANLNRDGTQEESILLYP
jgi:hypothetical protein